MWIILLALFGLLVAGTPCPSPSIPSCQSNDWNGTHCVVSRIDHPCVGYPPLFTLNASEIDKVVEIVPNGWRWMLFLCSDDYEDCRNTIDALVSLKRVFPRYQRKWNFGFINCKYESSKCLQHGAVAPFDEIHTKMVYHGQECCIADHL